MMKRNGWRAAVAALLASTSALAYAAGNCCGDLACCLMEAFGCCF